MPKSETQIKPEDRRLLNQHLQQALKQQLNGNLAAARRKCRYILKKAPDHGEALQLLAILMQQSGNSRSALHFMKKALKTSPKNPQLLKNLAEIYRNRGDLDEAQHYARAALEIAPDDCDALFILGAVFLGQDRQQQAIEQFTRVVELNPTDVEAHNELGNLMCGRNEPAAAIRHYQQGLVHQSEFHDCRINLADTLLESGDCAAAIEHYKFVLESDPHNATLHNRLGQAYVDCGETELALSCFELALEQNPLLLEARVNLGRLFLEVDPHQAENWFKSVLDIDPKNVEGYYWLGILFQTLGKFERASNYLQQSIRIDPEFVPAWFRLSLDRDFEPSQRQLQALERHCIRREGEDLVDDDQINLDFTLGRFHEQRDNHALAFRYFQQGNRLRIRRNPFDAKQHAAQIDRVIETFDDEFFRHRAGWGTESELPVFIIGMPRSGTTLVEQILGTHPAVHAAGELQLMLELVKALKSGSTADSGSHAACVAALDRKRVDEIATTSHEQLKTLSPEAERIVDKMPGNYFRLGLIRLLFPRAIIIHCQRDPMDTCWSCYQQNFESGLNFSSDLESLGYAYCGYRRLMAHWHRIFPDQILDVSYEALVQDPQTVSRKLLQHCGLQWQPEVLDYQNLERPVNTASLWQARQPIYQSSVGRWQDYREFLQPLVRLIADCD